MKVTILGCGGSGGVPLASGKPGGEWGACDPANPLNRRRRVSILVEEGATSVLVDASPDLREQLLLNDVSRIDAVIFTHAHADHCHGLDELRAMSYRNGGPIVAYMNAETRDVLTRRFDYAFASSAAENSFYRPILTDLPLAGPMTLGGVSITPFDQRHGAEITVGVRMNDMAYSTDANELDEAAFSALAGVRLWIVDCLRVEPHPTHSHLDRTLSWIERVKPDRAVLTHLNHQSDYEDIRRRCPPGVEPAYDGMTIEL